MIEISKKDLLEKTGISYGQLYRWKRERLIPEEWFVKRSAVTGQETYFPREQMLDRIEAILDLKEDHSLEEIRNILASEHSMLLGRKRIESLGILPNGLFDRVAYLKDKKEFRRGELAFIVMINEVATERSLSDSEHDDLLERSLPLLEKERAASSVVFLISAEGRLYVVLASEGKQPLFDSGIEIIRTASLVDLVAKLKIGRFDGNDEEATGSDGDGKEDANTPKIVNITAR
ncbi:MAG: YhbD family protein [Coriobacteriia bacterium]|nr:YhbD family protein [Coriobacteriia bacterium]